MDLSTIRQCPGWSGAAAGQGYCSQAPWQRKASIMILSWRSPSASDIGCSCRGSGTKPASIDIHSDTSMPLKRAASSNQKGRSPGSARVAVEL